MSCKGILNLACAHAHEWAVRQPMARWQDTHYQHRSIIHEDYTDATEKLCAVIVLSCGFTTNSLTFATFSRSALPFIVNNGFTEESPSHIPVGEEISSTSPMVCPVSSGRTVEHC